jgi:hypothetical protein
MAVKRTNPYGTVIVSHAVSLTFLLVLGIVMRAPLPPTSDLLWGCVAGLGGGVGLTLLYRALAS